jgi:hypothetical protein
MKKVFLALILSVPVSFLTKQVAHASSASSTIVNNVNTSSTNSKSTTTSHTDVTVETDGKVTHYTSDEPNKNIHVESNNGVSKIEVNGQEVSGSDDTNSNDDQSSIVSKSPTPTTGTNHPTETDEAKQNSIEKIIMELEKIISFFKGLFPRG